MPTDPEIRHDREDDHVESDPTPKHRRPRRRRRLLRAARSRARRLIGKLPLPEDGREPLDLSSPSVPYYTDLSRRFHLAQIVLYVVLFVFVVTAVVSSRERITYANLYYLVKDINAASILAEDSANAADRLDYPVSVTTPAFVRYRGGLVSVGSQEVSVISGSGKQTLTAQVDYGTPAVAASEKYFITYGRGENSFSVFNAFTQVHTETTEFPVYGAAVADDGSFLILTRSSEYTSRVVFYDRERNVRASYYLNGYALSVTIHAGGSYAAVLSVDETDGRPASKIDLFRLSDLSHETVELTDTLAGYCDFTAEDRVAVVCSDRLLVLRTDGSVLTELSLSDAAPLLCTVSSGRIALLSEVAGQTGKYSVRILDKNGKSTYTTVVALSAEPTSLLFSGDALYIRASGYLYRLTEDGAAATCARISREALCILPDGEDSVFVCTPSFAARLYARDHEPV